MMTQTSIFATVDRTEGEIDVLSQRLAGVRTLAYLAKHDVSTLRHLFLAGEPLDEPTARWISEALNVPVIDHYWQTETGWAILSCIPGVEATPTKYGSPSFPAYGYNVKLLKDHLIRTIGIDRPRALRPSVA